MALVHNARLMRTLLALPALILAFPLSAPAEEPDLRPSIERFNACVQQQNGEPCLGLLTAGSLPLYRRIMTDGLMPCLPADAVYVSQAPQGQEIVVRATTQVTGKPSIMRLRFTQENAAWKLNMPATLEAGMGDQWQQRLNTAEQIYLLLQQQAGGALNCAVLQGLVRSKR